MPAQTEEPIAPNELLPLRTGLDPMEAQVMKSVLASEGIECFLSNENMGTLGYGVRIDLLVKAVDKVRAELALRKVAVLPRRAHALPPSVDEDDIACPQCGSTRVGIHTGPVPTMIPGLKTKQKPGERWRHCIECGTYYPEGARRHFDSFFLAIMWGATLAGATLGLMWLIRWLRWL